VIGDGPINPLIGDCAEGLLLSLALLRFLVLSLSGRVVGFPLVSR
jgi:hypothetical protein